MGDILKEFKIVFGLDSKPLEQGVKKSESSLKSFGKAFGALAATYLTADIFKSVISGFVDFNLQLSRGLALTGGNVEEVSALGNAMKRFGGDTNSVINSMKTMNSHLHEAKYGGGALIEVAKKYGLVISKGASAEQTITKLASQMGRFDRQTRVAIAGQLGLDEAMTRAFADGGKELERLVNKQKALGVVTEKDLEISNQFNNSVLDLKDLFGALMRDFARLVVPLFTKLVDLFYSFVEYVRKHKVLVIGFFAALVAALSPILAILAILAKKAIAAFAPFYAIIGIITAIAVIFEDIYYYFMGYDSVTGKLVEKFPLLASILNVIKPIVVGIVETFSSLINFITNPSWDNFLNIFKSLGKVILGTIKTPFEWLQMALDGLINKFPLLGIVLKPVKAIVDSIVEAFKWLMDALANFSLDGLKKGLENIKNSVSDFGSNLLDKANPLNWFGGDEKELKAPDWFGGDEKELKAPDWFGGDEKELKAPAIPIQNSVTNANNSNVYNVNNNINQNITSATPQQLANSTNNIMLNSINQQRQQMGAL